MYCQSLLTFIHQSYQHKKGSIPSEIGNLIDLRILDIDDNSFSGSIPEEIRNLKNLIILELDDNFLVGKIPAFIGELTNLIEIDFDGNALTGKLPDSIGNLVKLIMLELDQNKFTGPIPDSFGNLSNLLVLELFENELTGSIPESLSELKALQEFELYSNELTGTLPCHLSKLKNLTHFNVFDNRLNGTIPKGLSTLPFLESFILKDNSFENHGGANNMDCPLMFNAETQIYLELVDISGNKFTGQVPPSVFLLPNLRMFGASSNCFTEEIPESICDATGLQTLAISGLNAGEACRTHFWENTPFSNIFDGFTTKHSVPGTIPLCIYTLPEIESIFAGGNGIRGDVPEKTSLSLVSLAIPNNKLVGTISKELALDPTLKFLDLSFNFLHGDLSAFEGSSSAYNGQMDIHVRVNRLSGSVPSSILDWEHIDILRGNVFGCQASRTDLPINDPAFATYQCGSSWLIVMLYVFAAIAFLFLLVFRFIYRAERNLELKGELLLWLRTASGKKVLDPGVDVQHIIRFSHYMSSLRNLAISIGAMSMIFLTMYCSLSSVKSRTIQNTFAWVSTAAYLKGPTATALCIVFGITAILRTSYMLPINLRSRNLGASDIIRKPRSESAELPTELNMLQKLSFFYLIPCFRLFLLFGIVIFIIVISNLFYLKSLRDRPALEQQLLTIGFSIFKLFWNLAMTPFLFRTRSLHFRLGEKYHVAMENALFGNRIRLMIGVQSLLNFMLPIVVALIVEPSCFEGVFYAAPNIDHTYGVNMCSVDEIVDGKPVCLEYDREVFHAIESIPFVYNYTCSADIQRAFVPVYALMFCILLMRNLINFVYICHLPNAADSQINKWLSWAFNDFIIPSAFFLHRCDQRRDEYLENKRLYPTKVKSWVLKTIPRQLVGILILLTFGLFAPLLGIIIVLSAITETLNWQLSIGKFLVAECAVSSTHKISQERSMSKLPFYMPPTLYCTPSRKLQLDLEVENIDEPWGALAAIKDMNKNCEALPKSVLSLGRPLYVILPSFMFGMVVNDIYRSDREYYGGGFQWVPLTMVLIPVSVQVLTWAWQMKKRGYIGFNPRSEDKAASGADEQSSSRKEVDLEMYIVSSDKTYAEEILNPLNSNAP